MREARLHEIRRQAKDLGVVHQDGIRPSGAPFLQATTEHGYYGLPALKGPPWTAEVPAYLFVGGAAGAAAVMGSVAGLLTLLTQSSFAMLGGSRLSAA